MALFGRRPKDSEPALATRPAPVAAAVPGERGIPLIARALTLQSRISNMLAMGLMLGIGAALLSWYYSHTAARPVRARQSAQASAANGAQLDTPLPSLGRIEPPALIAATNVAGTRAAGDAPAVVMYDASVGSPPLAPASAVAAGSAATVTTSEPALRPSAFERRLSGAAFTAAATPVPSASNEPALPAATLRAGNAPPASEDALTTLLQTQAPVAARARVLPTQRLLLPKGAFIDCTLETAIDSTLPSMTTCVTATDTFGADGSVVLLDRGTKLVGETRGQVQQGAARVFVLWTEARTPTGVVVPLDSPGTDELGRSGLPGEVERHFWERFGAAILVSSIDGAVQAAVQSSNRGGGTVIYNPSATQDVMTEVLKNTLNIAPTVVKNNGDRIDVLVARDVDFSNVYELRDANRAP